MNENQINLIIAIIFFILLTSILIGIELAILDHDTRIMQKAWQVHIDNGDIYLGQGKWFKHFEAIK